MTIFELVGKIAIKGKDQAEKDIDSVTGKAQSAGSKIGSTLKNGIAAVGIFGAAFTGAAVSAGGAVVAFSSKIAATGDNIDKMSQKIGISRQAYQELDFICSQSGTSVDSLQMGIKTLTNQMQAAQSGTKSAVSAFEQLGVSIYDSSGNLKDQEAMMWESMEALQSMENQTEKAALANDLFGRSGSELMPLLNGEAGSIEEMKKQAHELGLVMSDEFVDNSVKFTDTLDQAKRALKAAGTAIGGALLPIVQNAIGKFVEFAPKLSSISSEISKNLSPFIEDAIGNIKEFYSIVADKFSPIIDAFKNLGGAIAEDAEGSTFLQDAFEKATEIISSVWNSVGQPVFDAIVSGINWLADNWSEISEGISNSFSFMCDVWSTVWESIGKPVWDLISSAVTSVYEMFEENMPAIQEFCSNAFSGIEDTWENHLKPVFEAVKKILEEDVQPAFEFVWGEIVRPLIEDVFGTIAELWEVSLKPVFDGICDFLSAMLEGDWEAAFGGLEDAASGAFEGIKIAYESWKETVTENYADLFADIQELFSPMTGWVEEKLGEVEAKFHEIVDPWVEIFGIVSSDIKEKFDSAVVDIQEAFKPVQEFFEGIWGNIQDTFSPVASWFEEKFADAWSAVQDVFSAGGEIFVGIQEGIASAFTSIVNHIIDGINKVITVPFKTINSTLAKIKSIEIVGVKPFDWISEFEIPEIPKLDAAVEKYKDGGVMLDPTIFGFNPATMKPMLGGEAGAEAIAPIDILQKYVVDATGSKNAELVTALDSLFAKYTAMIVNAIASLAESGTIKVDDPYRIFKLVKDEERKFNYATGM